MRVALIQDHLRNGGTENQTLHIVDGLAKQGIDTHLIVFRRGGILDERAASLDCTLHFLKQGPLKTDWFAPGLNALLRRLRIDVIIPMGRMANCQAGLLANRQRAYRIVATVRTGKSLPILYRHALNKADHIVANSREALQRIANQYSIKRSESSVIFNGCIRKITPIDEIASPQAGPIRLLNASMFRPEKKQIRLLRICQQLPNHIDWHLTLAGDGSRRDACIREAQRLGIADRVSFPGLLKDPSSLYRDSDIAVHTSSKESLPNFLVEAQMSGLPVIAYDVGGVGETFIPDKSGYLIPHGNADTFLQKLQILIDSPDIRRQMSEAGRDYAERHFTPKAQLEAYIELLETLKPC